MSLDLARAWDPEHRGTATGSGYRPRGRVRRHVRRWRYFRLFKCQACGARMWGGTRAGDHAESYPSHQGWSIREYYWDGHPRHAPVRAT